VEKTRPKANKTRNKVCHREALPYGFFAWIASRVFTDEVVFQRFVVFWRYCWFAICALFAIADEYHQTFVPGRGGTWTDVAIDGIGIVIAALLAWICETRRGRR
jgi:VanZ family protein